MPRKAKSQIIKFEEHEILLSPNLINAYVKKIWFFRRIFKKRNQIVAASPCKSGAKCWFVYDEWSNENEMINWILYKISHNYFSHTYRSRDVPRTYDEMLKLLRGKLCYATDTSEKSRSSRGKN